MLQTMSGKGKKMQPIFLRVLSKIFIPTMKDNFDTSREMMGLCSIVSSIFINEIYFAGIQQPNVPKRANNSYIPSQHVHCVIWMTPASQKKVFVTAKCYFQGEYKNDTLRQQIKSCEPIISYEHYKRKKRKDLHAKTAAEACVYDYCHGDYNAIRIESNDAKPIEVNGEPHLKRVWDGVVIQAEKYDDFLKSDEYLYWKSRQEKRKAMIGKNSLIKFICKCIKDPTGEDCVNLITSDLSLSSNERSKTCILKAAKECQCEYHSHFRH